MKFVKIRELFTERIQRNLHVLHVRNSYM